jgi:hypothetical protein
MGEITLEMRRIYGSKVKWIPEALLPRLDQDEILDRLDDATALMKKFEQAPSDLALGYVDRAKQVCSAAPRDEVEQVAAEWVTKAEQALSPQHYAGCMEQARAIRDANPTATRRLRTLAPEQARHAEALALLKADIAAQVQQFAVGHTARMDQLAAGVAEVTAKVDAMAKTATPGLRSADMPDLTK